MRTTVSLLAALILAPLVARADVKLPAIVSDKMVLQADKPLPVWGWADAGEEVTVSLGGQKKSATAGADGKWMVQLDPVKASSGPVEMTVAGKNTLTVRDILVGEVWVGSGQSNMHFAMAGAHNAAAEIPKAQYPHLRLFTVKRATAFEPAKDVEGAWVECTPETVKGFSAVAYFFGRDLHQKLGVPVGMIHTSWGGTPAQAWTSVEGLKSDPALAAYVKLIEETRTNIGSLKSRYETEALPKYQAALKKWNETVGKEHRAALAKWKKEADAANAAGRAEPERPKPATAQPRKPDAPDQSPRLPAVLNNAMVAPIVPFALRGAIWYQGEANAGQPVNYRTLFPTMIKDWRRQWSAGEQGDFHFVWVQLANYMARSDEPTQTEGGWPGLREAQTMTLKLPNTAQAVTIDVGEAGDIHPKNKEAVGQRLALAALKTVYGKDVVHSGPTYDSMKVEGDKVRVKFSNVGGGLTIGSAPAIRVGEAPKAVSDKLVGFAVAGEDKQFVWAQAKIEGDGVVVWSDAVKRPVAVRYGWANNPEVNLYNKEGLPAGPFRTDDWVSAPVAKK